VKKNVWLGIILAGSVLALSGCLSAEQISELQARQKQENTITTQPGSEITKTYDFGSITLFTDETLDTADIVVADANLHGIRQLRIRPISKDKGLVKFQLSMRIDDDAPDGEQPIVLDLNFKVVDGTGKITRQDTREKTIYVDIKKE